MPGTDENGPRSIYGGSFVAVDRTPHCYRVSGTDGAADVFFSSNWFRSTSGNPRRGRQAEAECRSYPPRGILHISVFSASDMRTLDRRFWRGWMALYSAISIPRPTS